MLYLEDYLESEWGKYSAMAARGALIAVGCGLYTWTGVAPPNNRPLCLSLPSCLSAVIEQLPMDLRDRFTEMREMDLQVQST